MKSLQPIKHKSIFDLGVIPLQWISKIEFYYPDIEQFPIVYVHKIIEEKRVYGFPVTFSTKQVSKDDKFCSLQLEFLSNTNLNKDKRAYEEIKKELQHRLGLSDPLDFNNLIAGCNGNKLYEDFFTALWPKAETLFGDKLQFGRLYEEIYSIVRFVAAWAPPTGRQSEMRMVLWFLTKFGEKISIDRPNDFYDFFLLPTYEEVLNQELDVFPKFKSLLSSIKKFAKIFYTNNFNINNTTFESIKDSNFGYKKSGKYKKIDNSGEFREHITAKLLKSKKINLLDQRNLNELVEAFNRHPGRATYFMSSLMNIYYKDYRSWNKDFFVKYYMRKRSKKLGHKGIGISEKVIACFLQQGFGKDQFIPIDTWIEAFHKFPLGLEKKEDFLSSFSNLGKIERLIWQVAQAKKVNHRVFHSSLWCIRYGNQGNVSLRGNNPVSCYVCELRKNCPGYKKIKDKKILLVDESRMKDEVHFKKQSETSEKLVLNTQKIIKKASENGNDCYYIISVTDHQPKKVCVRRNAGSKAEHWEMVDEWSSRLLKSQEKSSLKATDTLVTVEDYIESLPIKPNYWQDSDISNF